MTTVVEAEPPGPEQVSVKLGVAASAETASLPLVGRTPLQPPDALQASVFVEDHESVVDSPASI